MAFSCRSQAFLVDNLLRRCPDQLTVSHRTSLSAPCTGLATPSGFSQPHTSGKTTDSIYCTTHDAILGGHVSFNTQHSLQCVSCGEGSKPSLLCQQGRVPLPKLAINGQGKYGDGDTLTKCLQGDPLPRIVGDISSKSSIPSDARVAKHPQSTGDCVTERHEPLLTAQHQASPNSCFCHGDLNLCNHPGVMVVADSNGSGNTIVAELCHADLWASFHQLGTEMIITKSGRRMFPALKFRITGLDPDKQYFVRLEFTQPDTRKYRYIYHSSRWMVSGSGDTLRPAQTHRHAELLLPSTGQAICSQIVSFERLKLTNTEPCQAGQESLISMQKFQPQVVIEEATATHQHEQYLLVFPNTSFMAVTAYQNQQITTLKIASNPFAKGFRESGRARMQYESLMAGMPSFLSSNDCLPGLLKPLMWPPCFPRDSSNPDDGRCDTPSGASPGEAVPSKMRKIEFENCRMSSCKVDGTQDKFSMDEIRQQPQKQTSAHLLGHRNYCNHQYQLYQQHKQPRELQQPAAVKPLYHQELRHRVILDPALSLRIPVPTVDELHAKVPFENLSLQTSVPTFALPPETTLPYTSEFSRAQLLNLCAIPASLPYHLVPSGKQVFRSSEVDLTHCLHAKLVSNGDQLIESTYSLSPSSSSVLFLEHSSPSPPSSSRSSSVM